MPFTRRDFLATSSLALAGAATARVPLWAQGGQAPPTTKFEEIRRGVGMFTGQGGTIGYLLNADGAIAVDSQFPATAGICVSGLKERAPKGIELLINTHHHGDHVGGNAVFKPAVKQIVAHENCAKWHRQVAEKAGTAAEQAFATTTFTDAWKVDFGGETVHARYHGAGHTSGDAVITFEKANVVHGGDLLFNRVHPFIDRPAGASIANWIVILEKTADAHAADTVYIFGHGKDGAVRLAKADVLFFRDYLTAVLNHGKKAVAAGQSKDEATKIAALPGFTEVAQINPRLSLEAVLGVAYDEASQK